ncbi:MAG: NTP transferase domain-containing protein [Chloroflexi bacterium]|jgi:molybdopterin-guanine dinucleotide biosynthesis protein A|nr:NTP transferase domain-containing protein [Chloroflexota bacterium]
MPQYKQQTGVTVAIQAGGTSTRMGTDKSFVSFRGRPMIEVVQEKLSGLGDEIILITNRPDPYAYLNLPMFADTYMGSGPLAGIFTALTAASYSHTLIVACDMPLLNRPLLQHLISLKETADVVVPRWGKYPEPLHAVYGKTCIPAIEKHLEAGKLKITGFFAEVRVYFVEQKEIERFDPQGRSFTNINTPEDLL